MQTADEHAARAWADGARWRGSDCCATCDLAARAGYEPRSTPSALLTTGARLAVQLGEFQALYDVARALVDSTHVGGLETRTAALAAVMSGGFPSPDVAIIVLITVLAERSIDGGFSDEQTVQLVADALRIRRLGVTA